MAYQITLSDQEYATLVAAAPKSGTEPEQLLHDIIQHLQPAKHPLTANQITERQYREGKIAIFRQSNH